MRFAILLILFLLFPASPTRAETLTAPEYQVKAAYLYNFLKLATFPGAKAQPKNGFQLCVVGEPELRIFFRSIEGKQIRLYPLRVIFQNLGADMEPCHILFVTNKADRAASHWLELTKGKSIITVGESETFCARGGMFRFLLSSETVQIEFNEKAATAAGIEFDPALKAVASTNSK